MIPLKLKRIGECNSCSDGCAHCCEGFWVAGDVQDLRRQLERKEVRFPNTPMPNEDLVNYYKLHRVVFRKNERIRGVSMFILDEHFTANDVREMTRPDGVTGLHLNLTCSALLPKNEQGKRLCALYGKPERPLVCSGEWPQARDAWLLPKVCGYKFVEDDGQ